MINVDTSGAETLYFYHYDGLGSVIALSDTSGNIVERYTYTPYGAVTITDSLNNVLSDSAYGNPYMFTGRRFDSETGLYYYRARMYSPTLGRFMQPDPIGYGDGMNIYTYCGNNPVNWIDPWGMDDEESGQGWIRWLWNSISHFTVEHNPVSDSVKRTIVDPSVEHQEELDKFNDRIPIDMYQEDPQKAIEMDRKSRGNQTKKVFYRALEGASDSAKECIKDKAGDKIMKKMPDHKLWEKAKKLFGIGKDAKKATDEATE